ncbi:uncharacterized protein LY79DRAFT_273398 [Colletotrichum navitas]|uniref:Secreted protein n=1 Tax=Colletotrichum navitas TaxID=681940 RepID=A0AAD8PW80_9PEZI|nr:uncharacterized protein LY79DRAFT_273398 [Colletotrichum navitas]KAK1585210.1 hypothetical protein LY79DRAFT_273398 [Colletotrichum navitas]
MKMRLFGFLLCSALPGFPTRHPAGEADRTTTSGIPRQPCCKRPFLFSFESDLTTCVPHPLKMMSGSSRIQGRPFLKPCSARANNDRATDTTTAAVLAGADQPTRLGRRKFLCTGMRLGFLDLFLVECRVSYSLRDA